MNRTNGGSNKFDIRVNCITWEEGQKEINEIIDAGQKEGQKEIIDAGQKEGETVIQAQNSILHRDGSLTVNEKRYRFLSEQEARRIFKTRETRKRKTRNNTGRNGRKGTLSK